jgi:hypothetical protein
MKNNIYKASCQEKSNFLFVGSSFTCTFKYFFKTLFGQRTELFDNYPFSLVAKTDVTVLLICAN